MAQIDARSAVSSEWTKSTSRAQAFAGAPEARQPLRHRKTAVSLRCKSEQPPRHGLAAGRQRRSIHVRGDRKTEASLKDVNKLREKADDGELLVVISALSNIVKRFLATNEEVVNTQKLKNDDIVNRTVKEAGTPPT